MPEQRRWFRRNPKKALGLGVLVFFLFADWVFGLLLIPADHNGFRAPHPVFHHALLPNQAVMAKWGDKTYPMFTNSLGFRDRRPRQVSLKSKGNRLLIIGDSFGEGVGVLYEETFAGMLESRFESTGLEVLNASVVSYSPKLYYLKTKHLLEEVGLEFEHLMVFIDISDIQNEIAYEVFQPGEFSAMSEFQYHLGRFGRRHSFLWHLVAAQNRKSREIGGVDYSADGLFPHFTGLDPRMIADPDFQRLGFAWTIDKKLFDRWGNKGLTLAVRNMREIVGLCKTRNIRMTVVVYPWSQQIVSRDLDSIQVKTWRAFAKSNGIGFVNLFPKFIDDRPFPTVYAAYFIDGDAHWNPYGHRLVANTVAEQLK
jgi:hypothetical protein